MSNSPLVTRTQAAVNSALVAKGAPAIYQPDLEYIILQVFTSLSTDSEMDAGAQAAFVSELALAAGDASP